MLFRLSSLLTVYTINTFPSIMRMQKIATPGRPRRDHRNPVGTKPRGPGTACERKKTRGRSQRTRCEATTRVLATRGKRNRGGGKTKRRNAAPSGVRERVFPGRRRDNYGTTVITQQYDDSKNDDTSPPDPPPPHTPGSPARRRATPGADRPRGEGIERG